MMDIPLSDINQTNLSDTAKSKPIYQAMQDDLYFILIFIKNITQTYIKTMAGSTAKPNSDQINTIKNTLHTTDIGSIKKIITNFDDFEKKYETIYAYLNSELLSEEIAEIALKNYHTFTQSFHFTEILVSSILILESFIQNETDIEEKEEFIDQKNELMFLHLEIKKIEKKSFDRLTDADKKNLTEVFMSLYNNMLLIIPTFKPLINLF